MNQFLKFIRAEEMLELVLPDAEELIIDNVQWGRADALFTPAYWKLQYLMAEHVSERDHRIGSTFEEEVVACLLGGYGIPAEVGLAAFNRARERGLIASRCMDVNTWESCLSEPLSISAKQIRYRFWSQKARYVSGALKRLAVAKPPLHDDLELRGYLLTIAGIGPKTSSWIVRNWLGSDRVAILDIHVVRAGQFMGLFRANCRVESDYFGMEERFLLFSTTLGVPARHLDALIWAHMRQSPLLIKHLRHVQSRQAMQGQQLSR